MLRKSKVVKRSSFLNRSLGKYVYLYIAIFLFIAIAVNWRLVISPSLIGRSIDNTIPPVNYLFRPAYKSSFSTWSSVSNGGEPSIFSLILIPVNSMVYLPALFGAGVWFISRYQLILSIFLSLTFFFILAKKILAEYSFGQYLQSFIAILGALFFTFNSYFFNELVHGSNAIFLTFPFLPLFLYSLLSLAESDDIKYFFLALLALTVLSSSLPHLVFAYLLIFVILAINYKAFQKFFKLIVCHLLLSLYWLIPLIFSFAELKGGEAAGDYTKGLTISPPTFFNVLINKEYFGSRNTYNMALGSNALSQIWVVAAIALLFFGVVCVFRFRFFRPAHKKLIIAALLLAFISAVFTKGTHPPFGDAVLALYKSFPLMNIFRSTQHFYSLYVLSVSLLFIFSATYLVKKSSQLIFLISILVVVNAMPWWYTGDLGTRNILSNKINPSHLGLYQLTAGDRTMYALNKSPLDFNILTVPPGFSIDFLSANGGVASQGGDAGLRYGAKGYFSTDREGSRLNPYLQTVEKEMYEDEDFFNKYSDWLSLLGIRYIVLRKDTMGEFSKYSHSLNWENIDRAVENCNLLEVVAKDGAVTVLQNRDFYPKFYIPSVALPINKDNMANADNFEQDKLPKALFADDTFSTADYVVNKLGVYNKAYIEYKKVSNTKYRVTIHNANSEFLFVFDNSYHSGWKVYGANKEKRNNQSVERLNQLDSFEDQMPASEAISMYNNGELSAVGDRFISKRNKGIIQNDNLKNGSIIETWFKRPVIDANSHLVANGYANSWVVDPGKICDSTNGCYKNKDGSYDMNLIVEFWPQRLFYVGFLVGSLVLLACLSRYLGFLIKSQGNI